MTEVLLALSQALSVLSLYDGAHPSRERALDWPFLALEELLFLFPELPVTFLGGEVMMDGRTLGGLDRWSWGRRFEEAGIQRIQVKGRKVRDHDQYTNTHSLNVAVPSMALAEFLGLRRREVQGIGVAEVLHDIGKVRIDRCLLLKPGKLTPEEWEAIQQHPVEGARLLMDSDEGLELAAIVAYEHHIWYSGGVYPHLRQPRACHPARQLLHVCDVIDRLATHRPYRDAWDQPRILEYILEGSGTEFDPASAKLFVRMMTRREPQVALLASPSEPLLGVYQDV